VPNRLQTIRPLDVSSSEDGNTRHRCHHEPDLNDINVMCCTDFG